MSALPPSSDTPPPIVAQAGGGREKRPAPPSSQTPPGVRMVGIRLEGKEFGPFQGAIVETPVDEKAGEVEVQEAQSRTLANMRMLVRNGHVRYNPPGYQMKVPEDYFDRSGHAYIGITVWKNGQMYIERLKVADQR